MQSVLSRFKDGRELKVLLLEDSEDDAVFVQYQLRKSGIPFILKRVEKKDDFIDELHHFSPDVILSDYNLPSFDGMEALELRNIHAEATPFIFVSGFLGEERAVETLKNGATNFVLKDNLSRLRDVLISALRESEERTKRISYERALQKSEAKYRQLIEQAADGIFIGDEGLRFLDVNSRACQLLGYSKEELLRLNVYDLVPPEAPPPSKNLGALATGESLQYETLRKRKDGSVFAVEMSVTKTTDGYFQAIMRDISRRKATEKALEFALQKLEFHVTNSPLAVIECDRKGIIKRWSGQAENIFGWPAEEAVGKHPNELQLIHPDERKEGYRAFKKNLENASNNFFYHCRCYTKERTIIYVEWYNSIFLNENGQHNSLLSLANDVTLRKVAEEARWEGQMEERSRIAREIHEGIGQLLVASKFRISSLECGVPLTEEKIGEVESLLEKTIAEVRRISLNIAPRSIEEISIENSVRQLCQQIKKMTGLDVIFHYSGQAGKINNSILSTVYRLVQEALNNSIQHAHATQVQIDLKQDQKAVSLSVKDDGKGFDISKVDLYNNNSLGNMKERVKMLGGYFQVDSSAGNGTKVAISIPLQSATANS